jgi:hypothetical protein
VNFKIPAPVDPLTPDQEKILRSLSDPLKLAYIETVSFSGNRTRPGLAPNTTFELTYGGGVAGDRLQYRFNVTATLIGEDGEPIGNVGTSIVTAFRIPESLEVGDWLIRRISPTAAHMTYPHLREVIQSLAARLGCFGVTLPTLSIEPDKELAALLIASRSSDQEETNQPEERENLE